MPNPAIDLDFNRILRELAAQPGNNAPPPGWLAGAAAPPASPVGVIPSLNPLGGQEVSPLAVSGQTIPTGPASTTPGGMTITPVANPARPRGPATPADLQDLGGQYRAIQGMLGPQTPDPGMVRDQVEGGGTIVHPGRNGLAGLYSGPDRVGASQSDIATNANLIAQANARGQDAQQLFSRLGQMGNQNIELQRLFNPNSPDQIRAGNESMSEQALRSRLNSAFDESRRRNPNWTPAQHWQAAADQEGTTVARAQAVMGSVPRPRAQLPDSLPTTPAGTPTIQSVPGATSAPVPGLTPRTPEGLSTAPPPSGGRNSAPTSAQQAWQTFEDTHGSSNPADPRGTRQYQAGLRTTEQINTDITDFVNLMPRGVLQSDLGNVHRLLTEKFGTGPVERWYGQSFTRGSRNPTNEALQNLRSAQEAVSPGSVGVNTNTRNLINMLIRPFGFENTSGQ